MQRALDHLYRRAGAKYIPASVAGGWAVALALTAAGYALLSGYLGGSSGETALVIAVAVGASTAALAVQAFVSWGLVRPLQQWARGRRDPIFAAEIWTHAQTAGSAYVRQGAIAMAIVNTPVLVWGSRYLDVGWSVTPAAVALGWGTIATGWVIEIFLTDVALTPVRREVASALVSEPSEAQRRQRVQRKLLVTVPAAAFFGAYLTGSFILDVGSPEARLYTVLAATVAVTIAFSGPVVAIASGSILEPVRELISGTQRVANGDFSTRVPELTNDEFGRLARSFNQMQQGLRERQALHAAVGSYIDPAVAQRVIAGGTEIPAEAVDATVMFVDIVGFTRLAEGAPPEEVVSDLNDFFAVVIPVIERHGGHANKLLGDGLLAVFGAPRPLQNHADSALAAARDIRDGIKARYSGALRVGIGLNSGTVVVGSMGGGSKLDYTIVGDVVNVAARIEALTRETGDTILLAEATRERLTDNTPTQTRGMQSVRGRSGQVEVWAL